MPRQMTLATQADGSFEAHRKATRRDVFLSEMDKVVPWAALCAVIAPHYPKEREQGGRRPIGLERMLRIHFLQQWYALSDPAVEEALYDSAAMRRFVGIDLGREPAPDETTVCMFRHLLERHGLAAKLFDAVNAHLQAQGFQLSKGTIVDATIVGAAPSTTNKQKARDPEMHQTGKGQQWYFEMTRPQAEGRHAVPVRAADAVTSAARPHKAHIGVDQQTGLVHSVVSTAANVADVTQTEHLLHGREKAIYADAGYTGADKRVPAKRGRRWYIAAKRGKLKATTDETLRALEQKVERAKASIRAAVEHPFRVIKRQFGYRMVRYKGLAKNAAQVMTLFGDCRVSCGSDELPVTSGVTTGEGRQGEATAPSRAAVGRRSGPLTSGNILILMYGRGRREEAPTRRLL